MEHLPPGVLATILLLMPDQAAEALAGQSRARTEVCRRSCEEGPSRSVEVRLSVDPFGPCGCVGTALRGSDYCIIIIDY